MKRTLPAVLLLAAGLGLAELSPAGTALAQAPAGSAAAPAPAPLSAPAAGAEEAGLPFDAALRLVTSKSTDVRRADETRAIAAVRQNQARYLYFPALSGTLRDARSTADNPFAVQYERSAAISAEMNLYRFGGDRAKREAADATLAAAGETLTATAAGAELQAAQALIDVIELAKDREVEQKVVAHQRENLALVQRLYQKGAKPAQEVDKVAIDLSNEESRLADTELRLHTAEAQLASLAGQPVRVRPDWPWMDRFDTAGSLAPQELEKLPDHKALAAQVTAIDKSLGDYSSRWLPSLDVSAAYNVAHDNGPDFFGRGFTGALVLTVPIFDRLVTRADYAEQVHQKSIAETSLTAKDWSLRSDYEDARAGFVTALASARAREATLAKAKDLYERSLKGFRAGVLSANDLSLDESRLTDTALYVVQGWAAVHRYYARLLRDVGLPLAR